MRSEWVPLSAAALVVGVMSLVLGQMLNPGGANSSPAAQMLVAAESSGRWLAMSILFFGAAAAMVLGMPAVLTLFQERRGRGLGITGIAVFTVGCVGIGALSALMLMFRSLAVVALRSEPVVSDDIALVTSSLQEPALSIMLGIWIYGFLAGVLLIALGLFRSRAVPGWVPGLLIGFLAVGVLMPLVRDGTGARVVSAVALLLLAAGFTGLPRRRPRGGGCRSPPA
jgi:hypothetical protein